jgi:hypothetical protein
VTKFKKYIWTIFGSIIGLIAIIGFMVPVFPFISIGLLDLIPDIIPNTSTSETQSDCIRLTLIKIIILAVILVLMTTYIILTIKNKNVVKVLIYLISLYLIVNAIIFASDLDGFCGSDGQYVFALMGSTIETGFIIIITGIILDLISNYRIKTGPNILYK